MGLGTQVAKPFPEPLGMTFGRNTLTSPGQWAIYRLPEAKPPRVS